MEQYAIRGGNPLVGEVEIGGAKNAALPILVAAVMAHRTVKNTVQVPTPAKISSMAFIFCCVITFYILFSP